MLATFAFLAPFVMVATAAVCPQAPAAQSLNEPGADTVPLVAAFEYTLFFSSEFSLTSNHLGAVSDGDLLFSKGTITRTNFELAQHLGIMPAIPDIGLDSLGRTPATKSWLFSPEIDIFSRSLGPIQHGDLLNRNGFIAQTNQQLTASFVPMPVTPDAGLDAFHVDLATGELWFSLENPLFSQALGITLQPGDLLSSAGYVVRTNAQLLSGFSIVNPSSEGYGLDAVTRLPDGTILFSVDDGFQDLRYGSVGHGDVLSDKGYVVMGNLELIWPFEPLEDLGDFGLDALQVGPPLNLGSATRMAP